MYAIGQFSTEVIVPENAELGRQRVFVADINDAKIITDPTMILDAGSGSDIALTTPMNQVNRTNVFLDAVADGGQHGLQFVFVNIVSLLLNDHA